MKQFYLKHRIKILVFLICFLVTIMFAPAIISTMAGGGHSQALHEFGWVSSNGWNKSVSEFSAKLQERGYKFIATKEGDYLYREFDTVLFKHTPWSSVKIFVVKLEESVPLGSRLYAVYGRSKSNVCVRDCNKKTINDQSKYYTVEGIEKKEAVLEVLKLLPQLK